jgi:hypothetical protein
MGAMQLIPGAELFRRRDVDSRSLADGAVLVDLMSGVCFELNRVGSEIWDLLGAGATEVSICQALCRRYPIESAVLAADVHDLLEALALRGLIEAGPAGSKRD